VKVNFEVYPHVLQFIIEAGTSRGSFTKKETWIIKAYKDTDHSYFGIGEASPLKGLSVDYSEDYGLKLIAFLDYLEGLDIPDTQGDLFEFITKNTPDDMPSLRFGVETALLDLINGGKKALFQSSFTKGLTSIPINGLVWMGSYNHMKAQIDDKLKAGYDCIKIKIGAIDFEQELKLIEQIRENYTADEISIRVDANGAFNGENAMDRLNELEALDIHSIEQPVMPGQTELMRTLCSESILPIALDEELIGVRSKEAMLSLLKEIQPAYIILKPSLLGGFSACNDWIETAESLDIGWWMTSMLESNVGLNAIAQFASTFPNLMHQGLGTGQMYSNNIVSPLVIREGALKYNVKGKWGIAG
jgi:o-succinylbenzoate synthase